MSETRTSATQDGAPTAALSYLALGDSYTIGEGVAECGRWPVQLAAALRAEGIPLAAPRIIATTGWTTDELIGAMDEAGRLDGQSLVSLLIGVNNQYRGYPVHDYTREFALLLQRAIGHAGGRTGRVLVLSIPDWGVTPFAEHERAHAAVIAAEIDAFNAAARALCDRQGAAFVDITPVSRVHGSEPAMLADDGLHPSAAMYARWTALALPVVRHLFDDAMSDTR
ncbi:MAG: SGNH/GDSL hydrolase family protein [Pseudomonadota bacterium]|nr:SGNH/GDSL hydrolase family protein [Pseudomonadota bacterium]